MSENPVSALILAAGQSTRLKSRKSKVLHKICGTPMLEWVLRAARGAGATNHVIVVGHQAESIRGAFGGPDVQFATQEKQLGTAHAVLAGFGSLKNLKGDIFVLYGDTPLLRAEDLLALQEERKKTKALLSVLTTMLDNPTGYGRIVEDKNGNIKCVVEERDANVEEKKIRRVNTGVYSLSLKTLTDLVPKIGNKNAKGEYYLTDLIELARKKGKVIAVETGSEAAFGVNTRKELAEANLLMRDRILEAHMKNGVGILDPRTIWIEDGVEIGEDSEILPFTLVRKGVKIGCGCEVGPFAHLRAGSVLKDGAEIGNFMEVKNTLVGEHSKAKHLSYLGDAVLGKDVNIGAGTITANYDGKNKHRTEINDGARIGSNCTLVAPVKVGKNAVTGAGSVVTRNNDVPDGATVAGVPAREIRKK